MAKTGARKAKKRAEQRPPVLDDELAELASVLAEFSLDNNAFGWFRLRWRDGKNAIELAAKAAGSLATKHHTLENYQSSLAFVQKTLAFAPHTFGTAVYESAGLHYNELLKINTDESRLTCAALRGLQLIIARSDAGGEAYNELLIQAFGQLVPEDIEQTVMEFRCRDAIGTTHQLQGDHNDRQRRAFTIAWRRGLYHAAYSLPPAF